MLFTAGRVLELPAIVVTTSSSAAASTTLEMLEPSAIALLMTSSSVVASSPCARASPAKANSIHAAESKGRTGGSHSSISTVEPSVLFRAL
jgi:hypothetical protein